MSIFKPRRTFDSVVNELIEGLSNGTVTLSQKKRSINSDGSDFNPTSDSKHSPLKASKSQDTVLARSTSV